MVGPLAVLKYAGIAVAVALPVTLPTLVDRCASCVRAKGEVAKEAGMGVLNVLSCGVLEIIRTMKSSPYVREDTLEAVVKKVFQEMKGKSDGPAEAGVAH